MPGNCAAGSPRPSPIIHHLSSPDFGHKGLHPPVVLVVCQGPQPLERPLRTTDFCRTHKRVKPPHPFTGKQADQRVERNRMGCLSTASQAAPDLAANLSLLVHLSLHSQAPRMVTYHMETCPHCFRHTVQLLQHPPPMAKATSLSRGNINGSESRVTVG